MSITTCGFCSGRGHVLRNAYDGHAVAPLTSRWRAEKRLRASEMHLPPTGDER